MNVYLWTAVSVAVWCLSSCIAGLVLGRLIAFGTQPLIATEEARTLLYANSVSAVGVSGSSGWDPRARSALSEL